MILRRFTQHLKDQNWFAVWLDVLVVIVGIFLGMQVTEWNEARKEKIEEQRLLLRLNEDLRDSVTRLDLLLDNLKLRNENREIAVQKIFSEHETVTLSNDECDAIWSSHIPIWTMVQRPSTLDEIMTTAKLVLIQDKELRQDILKFHKMLELQAKQIQYINEDLSNLVEDHANAFPRQPSGEGDTTVDCYIDRIRNSQTILNKTLSNHARLIAMEARFTRIKDSFTDLQTGLPKIVNTKVSPTNP